MNAMCRSKPALWLCENNLTIYGLYKSLSQSNEVFKECKTFSLYVHIRPEI